MYFLLKMGIFHCYVRLPEVHLIVNPISCNFPLSTNPNSCFLLPVVPAFFGTEGEEVLKVPIKLCGATAILVHGPDGADESFE